MTIKSYTKNDQTLYKVTIRPRSKCQRSRIQKQRSGITSLREARKIERELYQSAILELSELDRLGLRWKDLVEEWRIALHNGQVGSKVVSPLVQRDYAQLLATYAKQWSYEFASNITPADVKRAIQDMDDLNLSNSRKRLFKTVVNQVFNFGIENRLISGIHQSPCIGIKVSRTEEKKPEILSISEIRKLLSAARELKPDWYPIYAGALLTGMRSGELYALKWTDVDWENKKLTVNKSWNGRLKKVKATKGNYWRDVPINSQLETLLRELRMTSGGREEVFPRLESWKRGEGAKILRAFCAGIGIPSIRFHALRACFATQLLRESIAPAVVMKICGWKELKTMQVYIRLAGIEIDGATNGLMLLPERETMNRVVDLFNH